MLESFYGGEGKKQRFLEEATFSLVTMRWLCSGDAKGKKGSMSEDSGKNDKLTCLKEHLRCYI